MYPHTQRRSISHTNIHQYYKAVPDGVETRWISSENKMGKKGEGGMTNFYRSDDVSATAYFYLDRPPSNLPGLPSLELKLKQIKEKVYDSLGEK